MIRYRLAPHAAEDTEQGRWVAAFPAGPIVLLEGTGPLLLDLLAARPDGATAEQLTDAVRACVDRAPADLGTIVAAFCEELVRIGAATRCDPA